MAWLQYSDDEVTCFHREFLSVANDVLRQEQLEAIYSWEHHLRSVGSSVIPDFVLVERSTQRWMVVMEIKRSLTGVYSTRNQVQAKGYAEENQTLFNALRPKYFCISNLEVTLLFALNGSQPPKDCRIKDMAFESGSFKSTPKSAHRQQLLSHLSAIVRLIHSNAQPVFESVWPRLAHDLIERANVLAEPVPSSYANFGIPRVVSDYFSGGSEQAARHNLLLRCLLTEFLRGILHRYRHPQAATVPALQADIMRVASAIDGLRSIDFQGVFEDDSAALYRSTAVTLSTREAVEDYLAELETEGVGLLAQQRGDALGLPDALSVEVFPLDVQERRGKIPTDPDLAYLLAALCIDSPGQRIIDPCAGDGNLLSAAYDVLRDKQRTHAQALDQLHGIEADIIATKLAALRLVLKEPHVAATTDACFVRPGDMFSSAPRITSADVILMNPPFKRYEDQDDSPIPLALREHYSRAIIEIGGQAQTAVGQSNIYGLYVEYIICAAKAGATVGVVLDNRWYHNLASEPLRSLLLSKCEIVAIVEYPHHAYFKDWTIATSLLIVRKAVPLDSHEVQFIRTSDPRRAAFDIVANALRNEGTYPLDWRVNRKRQVELDSSGWKHYFAKDIENEFRKEDWPLLTDLFKHVRRGALEKEGGGTELYDFPGNRSSYGPKRVKKVGAAGYQTTKGLPLTAAEEVALRQAAAAIPESYRGLALKNSDGIAGYSISVADACLDWTLESPAQRSTSAWDGYSKGRSRRWDKTLDEALIDLKRNPHTSAYIALVEDVVGFSEDILPKDKVWHCLREPYAGELVIPRKLRNGHRVHVNPFAFNPTEKQLRLSSNFFSYSDYSALDVDSGLTRSVGTQLVAAFLMSSFGQLQFEMESYNREGARSVEQHHLEKIRVFDPRWIQSEQRVNILSALAGLPYPLPTDRPPTGQPELLALDDLFADEIVRRHPDIQKRALLAEVHQLLFEWLEARNP
jgi:hypothetical protein